MPRLQASSRIPSLPELAPFEVADISYQLERGFWGFNPCIHKTCDQKLLLVTRFCNYTKIGGRVTVASRPVRSRNFLCELSPETFEIISPPVEILAPEFPRARRTIPSMGIEDLRLYNRADGSLGAICTQLHTHERAEMLELTLGANYQITGFRALGGAWSRDHQKNWVPFDGFDDRFLYAIERGLVIEHGILADPEDHVDPEPHVPAGPPQIVHTRGGCETRHLQRQSPRARVVDPFAHEGLRGGSQLVQVGIDLYLGVGHYTDRQRAPHYSHALYLVTSRGKLVAKSATFRLSDAAIEFAAGLAIHGDQALISFGIDDNTSRLGRIPIDAALGLVRPPAKEGAA